MGHEGAYVAFDSGLLANSDLLRQVVSDTPAILMGYDEERLGKMPEEAVGRLADAVVADAIARPEIIRERIASAIAADRYVWERITDAVDDVLRAYAEETARYVRLVEMDDAIYAVGDERVEDVWLLTVPDAHGMAREDHLEELRDMAGDQQLFAWAQEDFEQLMGNGPEHGGDER